MKHLLLFYSCLLFLAPYVGAQDKRTCADYDFSPQAFAMLTNENVHLDLNTGTLNVSIPVYDWKDEDFMLPLRMTYSTNGFKPARPTGIVGLDWSLQLGGVISRQIVGIDDLKTCGYYYTFIPVTRCMTSSLISPTMRTMVPLWSDSTKLIRMFFTLVSWDTPDLLFLIRWETSWFTSRVEIEDVMR